MIESQSYLDLPPTPAGGTVISIGVFDGVHLGHQAILAANVSQARKRGARSTVVTFAAHPKTILLGHAPRTLTTLDHRLELFERAGIEHSLALVFDDNLRRMSARDFLETVLLGGLGACSFVLGFDSKFGAEREGTPAWLREAGHEVQVVQKVMAHERAVSSTAIREAVELGDLNGAASMLGRRPSVLGRVVRGAGLGRKLGFPTANMDLQHELHPPPGVWAVRAHRLAKGHSAKVDSSWNGVCNIGYRPTLDGTPPAQPLVEVHLLDFEGDLYGQRLEIEFFEGLRGEQRFDSLEALTAQIGRDAAEARAVLARAAGARD
ncbi:MAG TPA: bifunctional riboflavin kinase/FAD synthetase [Planctomycetes bacterium]|nr:bifunctional riboflavin kinase/FAD synthetase [Planctomycetota bacterium]